MPLDTTEQMRAFSYEDQLVLFSSHQNNPRVQVALLDTKALDAGRQNFVTAEIQSRCSDWGSPPVSPTSGESCPYIVPPGISPSVSP